jgi:hypothetical protein
MAAKNHTVTDHSAPVTASDVWRFNNAEDVQASNALVGNTISDTLEHCASVLAFISDFHTRNSDGQMDDGSETGLVLVVDWVLDAIKKQSKALEVNRG